MVRHLYRGHQATSAGHTEARAIFQQVHELSQAGRRAIQQLVAARLVWPGLATDVVTWCKECAACNRAKVTRQPSTTVEMMAIPTARFSHVQCCVCGHCGATPTVT